MNERLFGLLLALCPRAWRARYGAELTELVAATRGDRAAWRTATDVAATGLRERLRAVGLAGDGLSRPDRALGGCPRVLWGWMLMIVAGAIVQKSSEHWQSAVPAGSGRVPSVAFSVLVAGAVVGALAVAVGIALALPGPRGPGARRRGEARSADGSPRPSP